MSGGSTVTIVDVHPDLLGTYGDGGNAVVLAQRLRWRGHEASVHRAYSGKPVPAQADIYCIGGGEDGPQSSSAAALLAEGCLVRAVAGGAVVLAVCAGFQIVGESFAAFDGGRRGGLGLLEVRTVRGTGRRAVGELVVAAGPAEVPPGAAGPGELGLTSVGLLSGYENHGGVTELGPGVAALGRVLTGVGNGGSGRVGGGGGLDGGGGSGRGGGAGSGVVDGGGGSGRVDGGGGGGGLDGAVTGRVVGTYLHGPVLARNPALADRLLSWVVGPLGPLDDAEMLALRSERLAAASRSGLGRLSFRRR